MVNIWLMMVGSWVIEWASSSSWEYPNSWIDWIGEYPHFRKPPHIRSWSRMKFWWVLAHEAMAGWWSRYFMIFFGARLVWNPRAQPKEATVTSYWWVQRCFIVDLGWCFQLPSAVIKHSSKIEFHGHFPRNGVFRKVCWETHWTLCWGIFQHATRPGHYRCPWRWRTERHMLRNSTSDSANSALFARVRRSRSGA